jgi:hypothetical protein
MSPGPDLEVPSSEETTLGLRLGHHLGTGLKALCIPLVSSGLILANGNLLSERINIDPSSILFRLWPYNSVYLRQFAGSTYNSSEIKWFFTVVSLSNLVWLIFICWKVLFEVLRRDVEFPPGRARRLEQAVIAGLVGGCVLFAGYVVLNFIGFGQNWPNFLLSPSLKEPIAVGAIKIVGVAMFFIYFGAALILEFGGLALRYLLHRVFGYFAVGGLAKPSPPPSP